MLNIAPVKFYFRMHHRKSFVLSLMAGLILLYSGKGLAQNQKYAIYWGDDEIGLMKVSKKKEGKKTIYDFQADVEFRVILKYVRNTRFNATYIGDTLIFCSSKSVMNDKLKDFQYTKKKGEIYERFRHPSDSDEFRGLISKSVALMYFSEPASGLKKIYAEGQSKFCEIEKMAEGVFKLYLDDDKTNIYHYKNGKLHEVEVKRTWFDLVFKRIF